MTLLWQVTLYQSSLSHAAEIRFNPVSLLGTAFSMGLIIEPIDKQTLHRYLLSSHLLVKTISLSP